MVVVSWLGAALPGGVESGQGGTGAFEVNWVAAKRGVELVIFLGIAMATLCAFISRGRKGW